MLPCWLQEMKPTGVRFGVVLPYGIQQTTFTNNKLLNPQGY